MKRLWTGEVGRENVEEAESMIKKWRERERREFSLIFGESAHVSSVLDDFQAAPSLSCWYVFGWTGYLVE